MTEIKNVSIITAANAAQRTINTLSRYKWFNSMSRKEKQAAFALLAMKNVKPKIPKSDVSKYL